MSSMPTGIVAGFSMRLSGETRGLDKLKFINNNRQLIVGIGSALVDILIHEKDEFLIKAGAVKGGMILVDKEHIERTLAIVFQQGQYCSGGIGLQYYRRNRQTGWCRQICGQMRKWGYGDVD